MWDNDSTEAIFYGIDGPCKLEIAYSNIKGGNEGIVSSINATVIWLDGNMSEDPKFLLSSDHPFALASGSPCINIGHPDTSGLLLPGFDLAGNPRIWNERIDIGAYEWNNIGIRGNLAINNDILEVIFKPNPFTTSTTLSYTLDKPENIRFTVYNVQSQIVYRMQERQEKGEQLIQWNAEGLPAGMYYFRIQAGEMVGSGKVVKLE